MTQIVHLADIHIGVNNSLRTEEYAEVFSGLVIPQGAIVVIAGDIFHRKTELHADDIDLFNMLLDKLTAGGNEVIIIPGNHDVNLQNTENKDLIVPLVVHEDPIREICEEFWIQPKIRVIRPHVHYWRKSGIYELAGLRFIHVSLKCTLSTQEILDLVPGHILLYHGMVEGVKFAHNPIITREIMRAADLCLFGDVHEFQFMHNTASAYPGSLIQQTIKEAYEKGYIIWSRTDCWRGEFIRAQNERYLVDLVLEQCTLEEVEKQMATIPQGQITKLRVTTADPLPVEIERMITDRVGNISTINYRPRAEEITREVIIEQFTKIMTEAGIGEDLIKKSIDEFIAEGITQASTRWYPKRMWWSNYYKYEENNYMEFREGIISGLFAPNCSGKSSVIDILFIGLFNQPLRSDRVSIIRDDLPSANMRLEFVAGGNLYTINRTDTIVNKKLKTSISLYGPSGNMSSTSSSLTYGVIKQLIGTLETTLQTCSISAYSTNIFDATPKLRVANLMSVLGLNRCNTLAEEHTKNHRDLLKKITKISKPSISVAIDVNDLNKQLTEAQQRKSDLDAKINMLDGEIANLREKIIPQTAADIEKRLSGLYSGELIDISQETTERAQWLLTSPKNTQAEPLECAPADLINWAAELSKMRKVNSRGDYKCDSAMTLEDALSMPMAFETQRPQPCEKPTYDVSPYIKYRIQGVDPKQGNLPELFAQACPIPAAITRPVRDKATVELDIELIRQETDHSREITMLGAELVRAKTAAGFKFNADCSCCVDNNKYAGGRLGEINEELTKLQAAQQYYVSYCAAVDELKNIHAHDFAAALEHEIGVTHNYKQFLEQEARFIAWEKYKEACGVINSAAEKYAALETKVSRANAYAIAQLNALDSKIKAANTHNNIVVAYEKLAAQLPHAIESDSNKNKIRELELEKLAASDSSQDERVRIRTLSNEINIAIVQNKNLAEYDEKTKNLLEEDARLSLYIKILRDNKFRFAIIDRHLNYLMAYANSILKEIADFTVSIKLENDEANAIIQEHGKKQRTLSMGSGYQLTASEFAFKLALSEIYPHSGQFLIIDEGFSTLDAEHTVQLANFIRMIADKYKGMLIITHNQEIARAFMHKVPLEFNKFSCSIREHGIEIPPAELVPAIVAAPAIKKTKKAKAADDQDKYHCACGRSIANKPKTIADHIKTAVHFKNMAALAAQKPPQDPPPN